MSLLLIQLVGVAAAAAAAASPPAWVGCWNASSTFQTGVPLVRLGSLSVRQGDSDGRHDRQPQPADDGATFVVRGWVGVVLPDVLSGTAGTGLGGRVPSRLWHPNVYLGVEYDTNFTATTSRRGDDNRTLTLLRTVRLGSSQRWLIAHESHTFEVLGGAPAPQLRYTMVSDEPHASAVFMFSRCFAGDHLGGANDEGGGWRRVEHQQVVASPPEQALPPVEAPPPSAAAAAYNVELNDTWSIGDGGVDANLLLLSLQGLTNRPATNSTTPRLYLTYPDSWAYSYTASVRDWVAQTYALIMPKLPTVAAALAVCSQAAKGYVVFDPAVRESIAVGLTAAGVLGAVLVSPALVPLVADAGLPCALDLRGKFSGQNATEIYTWARHQFFSQCSKHEIIWLGGICGDTIHPAIADWGVSRKAFFTDLDTRPGVPAAAEEFALAESLVTSLDLKAETPPLVIGWHSYCKDFEHTFTSMASAAGARVHGLNTNPNLSFMHRLPLPPGFEFHNNHHRHPLTWSGGGGSQVYVTLVQTDGLGLGAWNKKGRGALPYSWEVTLPDLEIQPALLAMFYQQATANDTFVAALSGPGYIYPKSSGPHLPRMLALAGQSMATLDLEVMVVFDATDSAGSSSALGDTTLPADVVAEYGRGLPNATALLNGYGPSFTAARTSNVGGKGAFLSFDYYLDEQRPIESITSDLQNLKELNPAAPYLLAVHVREYSDVGRVQGILEGLRGDGFEVVHVDEFAQQMSSEQNFRNRFGPGGHDDGVERPSPRLKVDDDTIGPKPAVAARWMVQSIIANTNTIGCADHGSKDHRCIFGRWDYGASIILDAMLYASAFLEGDHNASAAAVEFVDARLNSWFDVHRSFAYNSTHNITAPPPAFGQVIDVYPFAFLSRAQYHHRATVGGSSFSNHSDLLVAVASAKSILAWPKKLAGPDGLLARDNEHATASSCWGGGSNQTAPNASRSECVWGDDATMSLTLLSRLAAASPSSLPETAPERSVMQEWLAVQHSGYIVQLQDATDGLYFHGADASVEQHSCCKWGRANGWVMMAHIEVLAALAPMEDEAPSKQFQTALAHFRSHAAAVARVQSADGRFHQLLNDSSTWLETSATAMFTHAIAVGVMRGWLPKASYDSLLAKAWRGLSKVITMNGEVGCICGGCGVQATAAIYNHSVCHPPGGNYWASSPGLGSVIRAAVSLSRYHAHYAGGDGQTTATGDGPNILLNPNFVTVEEGTSNTPANWSVGTVYARSLEMHMPRATASLMYSNENPAVYQLATQSVPAAKLRGGCAYTLSATIKAHGLNTSIVGGGATIAAQWNAPPFYGDYLGSGPSGFSNWTTQSMTFVYPASAPPLSVAAYVRPLVPGTNKTPVGAAFWGNFSLVAHPPPRMKSFVLSPVYRGRITATAPAPIAVEVQLHFEVAATISVLATLTRDGHSGVVERQISGPYSFPATGPPGARTVALQFRVSPLTLEIGEYTVTVTCSSTDAAGDVCGPPQMHNLTRVNDTAPIPAVYIDQLRRTIVDGESFFPMGWFFGAGEEMTPGGKDYGRFELLARSPFNTVMPYGESSAANLDAAHSLGMKVVSSLKQVFFGLPAADGQAPAAISSIAAEAPYLRKRIAATRDHPALLAWYSNDELSQSFLPQLRTHYDVFKTSDPGHPTWQLLCEVGHISDYLSPEPTFDIIGSDPYPIGRPNQGAWGVHAQMNDTVVETAAARPVWETLQAINWKLYNPTMCVPPNGQCRTPNASEVRSMTWQSIALGANGIFFWEFNDLYRNPDVTFNESFAYFSAVAEEVLRFSSVLLSENGPALVPGASTPSNASHPAWLLLRAQRWPSAAGSVSYNNSLFLVAVSDGSGGGKVSFDFATACHAGSVLVTPLMPKTGAVRRVDGCQFDDDIAPLDVHAYNITISSSVGGTRMKTDDAQSGLFLGKPIWHRNSSDSTKPAPQYILFRKEFKLPGGAKLVKATLQITAQASPAIGSVDTGNQPKLLGGFKLALDGKFVSMGPGRSLYGLQAVDELDVTELLHHLPANSSTGGGGSHLLAISSFHSNQNQTHHYPWAPGASTPRLALGLRVTTDDGRTEVVVESDGTWRSFDAEASFNPSGNFGCIWYRAFQENLNMSLMPPGWWLPTPSEAHFNDDWVTVQVQPGFEQMLQLKATRPVLMSRGKVTLERRGPGHYIIDCGREIQGGITVRIKAGAATEGQQLTVGYGEEATDNFLNPPKPDSTIPGCAACTVRCCPMRTTNVFLSRWSLTSKAQSIFEHEYKVFRYAELVGAPILTDADVESWIVRYPFGDDERSILQADAPALGTPTIPGGLTAFGSSNANLDTVFSLSQYTNIAGSLDTSTDSNTRQRSTCHIDMRMASLAQLYSLDGTTDMVNHNVAMMLQNNSDIVDGWADFKAATVFTAHHALLHGGSNATAVQYYDRLKLFTLSNFINISTGLVTKPSQNIAGDDYMNGDFKCLNGTSPCAGDLVDWARNSRDNYSCEGLSQPIASTVPNAYAVQSIGLFADIAGWLNRTADAAEARRTAASLRATVAEKLFATSSGTFMDGLGFPHSAVHASIIAAATGVITTPAMADAVLAGLEKRGLYDGKVVTSCWIAGAILEGLYQMAAVSTDGRAAEVALHYLSRTGERSWMGMIAQGATMVSALF
jgi:hypothetical protein